MSAELILIILFAALLHAAWNALLRAGADRLWSMTVMCIAIAIVCAILAFFVAIPARDSWGYLLASAVLHTGYNLFLVRSYRSGELGQIYPISRGSSPLLVCLGAAIFAGELPDTLSLIGVALVSFGIVSLAFQGRKLGLDSLPYALGTGCFIGAYSVTDGIGARLSGSPVGYTVWMCLFWGVISPVVYVCLRDWRSLLRGPRETAIAAGGGIVSLIAYGIVIVAMSFGPMGSVSALRETSVVFAALIGRFFLHETLTARRAIACVVVAVGAACIGHGRGREQAVAVSTVITAHLNGSAAHCSLPRSSRPTGRACAPDDRLRPDPGMLPRVSARVKSNRS